MKFALALFATIALTACGGNFGLAGGMLAEFDNPQNRAGLNTTTLVWGKVDTADGSEEYQLKYLNLVNGQESGTLTLELALSDGTIYKFSGGEIKAFEAFATRGEVETAIAEKLGEAATPELIGALADLVTGGVP